MSVEVALAGSGLEIEVSVEVLDVERECWIGLIQGGYLVIALVAGLGRIAGLNVAVAGVLPFFGGM